MAPLCVNRHWRSCLGKADNKGDEATLRTEMMVVEDTIKDLRFVKNCDLCRQRNLCIEENTPVPESHTLVEETLNLAQELSLMLSPIKISSRRIEACYFW